MLEDTHLYHRNSAGVPSRLLDDDESSFRCRVIRRTQPLSAARRSRSESGPGDRCALTDPRPVQVRSEIPAPGVPQDPDLGTRSAARLSRRKLSLAESRPGPGRRRSARQRHLRTSGAEASCSKGAAARQARGNVVSRDRDGGGRRNQPRLLETGSTRPAARPAAVFRAAAQ